MLVHLHGKTHFVQTEKLDAHPHDEEALYQWQVHSS